MFSGAAHSATPLSSRQPADISPEERAQNVGRVLRKEADNVVSKWDRLNADSADWQRRLELALDRLMELQEAEDLLDGQLRQAEMVKEAWEPVGDLLIDSLPEHIDRVKVRHTAVVPTLYLAVFTLVKYMHPVSIIATSNPTWLTENLHRYILVYLLLLSLCPL